MAASLGLTLLGFGLIGGKRRHQRRGAHGRADRARPGCRPRGGDRRRYHGQWHLAGRLHRPLVEIEADELQGWLAAHPGGRVVEIVSRGDQPPTGLQPVSGSVAVAVAGD